MTDIENTQTTADTGTAGTDATGAGDVGGFGVVVGGLGFVGGGVVDLVGVVGGPFVTVDVVDGGGVTVAVVGVADTGDGVDQILDQVGAAAAVMAGGTAQAGGPVGSAGELGTRFEIPTVTRTWNTDGEGVGVVLITATDRRNTDTDTTDTGAHSGDSGVAGVPGVTSSGSGVGAGLDKLVNVALDVSVELGRTKVTLADVLDYDVGSVVELDRAAGAPVDVRVNNTLLAQGEVVLIDDEYAVRITAIIDPHTP